MNGSLAVWLAREAPSTFRVLRLPRRDLESLALRRLAWLLEQAARTPFYRSRLEDAGWRPGHPGSSGELLDVLRALPPVSKQELRAAGADALRGGRIDPSWRSSCSSGSTGEPFRVFFDVRSWAILKYLVKLRARAVCGLRPDQRLAVLRAVPPDRLTPLPLQWTGRLRAISTLQPRDRIAAALEEFNPDAIFGLPSALLDALESLPTHGASVAPRYVFTTSEPLFPSDRRALAEGYGGRVFDIYGTSEVKEIAWECPVGGLHVNADVVWVEVLNEMGDPAAAGEEGDIVVTSLVNQAMPLLRYRTGDRGILPRDSCPCKLPFPCLGVVTGRAWDVIELHDGRQLSPYTLAYELEEIEGLGLLRYQVVQLDPARLRVRARIAPSADPDVVSAGIHAALQRTANGYIPVEIEFVERFETGPSAKFRVFHPLRDSASQSPPVVAPAEVGS